MRTLLPLLLCLTVGFFGVANTANAQQKPKKAAAAKKAAPAEAAPEAAPAQPAADTAVTETKSYNGQPVLQFNTLGSPGTTSGRDTLQFKVPTDDKAIADDKMANPVVNIKNDDAFKTYIGYPKHQFSVNYTPGSYGGKFSYTSTTSGQKTEFNFSSTSTIATELIYRFVSTPSVVFEGNFNYFTAGTKAGTPGAATTVLDSTTNAMSLFVRGNYCYIGTNFFARLCPGVEFGTEQYPLVGYKNGTQLEMQKASELSYGINVLAQYPIVKTTVIKARLGYLMGTGSGGSGELTSKKNNALYLNTDIEWPMGSNYMNIGFYYLNRTSTVEGNVGNFKDKWDSNIGQLALRLGYTWDFGG